MSYAAIDIEYLEENTFHNERIFDFLSATNPLCSIHQTKTVLIFFYLFSFIILFLIYPQMTKFSAPLEEITILVPLIFTAGIHFLMSFLYILFALFGGASIKTCIGFIAQNHTTYPIIIGIGWISFIIAGSDLSLFFFVILALVSAIIEFIFLFISTPSHKFALLFQGIGLIPSLILGALCINHIISKRFYFICFVPYFLYYIVYISLLISLGPCCKGCNAKSYRFLSDPEISAEFNASEYYESFWNSAYWRETQTRHKSASNDSSSTDDDKRYTDTIAFIDTKKRDQKFPKKEAFQLYKLDSIPETPIFVASFMTTTAFILAIGVATVYTIYPFDGFYYTAGAAVLFLLAISMFNSRAFGYNSCAITNISTDVVDILWDHPSFSVLL